MSGFELYLVVLLVFMIIGAIIAVEIRSLISSVISLGVMGVGLSISFLFLAAPDLAIVQVAVEVLLLIFMIRATIGREVTSVKGNVSPPLFVLSILLCCAMLTFGLIAVLSMPQFGKPLFSSVGNLPSNAYVANGLAQTGSANLVTAVILDYRAFDTLGEATVLFASIIGALTILRAKSRKGENQ
jgi:multicomponent Na+:H+ antiporter subunit B